jgi:FMN reductase
LAGTGACWRESRGLRRPLPSRTFWFTDGSFPGVRPALFAYLRTLPVPASLFAATEDWGDEALNQRIDRAAFELVLLMESGFGRKVRGESWQSYQHEFGSAGGTELDIDTDSDLMRRAGGSAA